MNPVVFTRAVDPEIGALLQCQHIGNHGMSLTVTADAAGVHLARWEPNCYLSQRLTPEQARALAGELLACAAAHATAPGRG